MLLFYKLGITSYGIMPLLKEVYVTKEIDI